jgi:hypothetical protein
MLQTKRMRQHCINYLGVPHQHLGTVIPQWLDILQVYPQILKEYC